MAAAHAPKAHQSFVAWGGKGYCKRLMSFVFTGEIKFRSEGLSLQDLLEADAKASRYACIKSEVSERKIAAAAKRTCT